MNEEKQKQLERLVDSDGIGSVLDNLEDICRLKANHILSNWQDEQLAIMWVTVADSLGALNANREGWTDI